MEHVSPQLASDVLWKGKHYLCDVLKFLRLNSEWQQIYDLIWPHLTWPDLVSWWLSSVHIRNFSDYHSIPPIPFSLGLEFHLRPLVKGYLYYLPPSSLRHNHHKVPTPVLRPLTGLVTTQPNLSVLSSIKTVERCDVSLIEENTNTKHTHKRSKAQWPSDAIPTN